MGHSGLDLGPVTARFIGNGPRVGEGMKGAKRDEPRNQSAGPCLVKGVQRGPQPQGPDGKVRAVWVFQQR